MGYFSAFASFSCNSAFFAFRFAISASWPEALLGTAIGLALGGAYYLVIGRRLHPADSSGIKVWGQDVAPRPRAALQIEIDHLQDEKAKLEAELRRLRESQRQGNSADAPAEPKTRDGAG